MRQGSRSPSSRLRRVLGMSSRQDLDLALKKIASRLVESDAKERFKGFKKDLLLTFPDLNLRYLVKIHDGLVIPAETGRSGENVVEVTTDIATFLGILNRSTDAFTAFTTGKLKVQGSIPDLLKLQKLLR